ncbi:MAG: type III pantothenate kinase [Saprospiraceae bacterium]|nr:type III pantothenate kinase [Saprospiraceae bacterium]
MNLTIDIGNTKIKFARFKGNELIDFESFFHEEAASIKQWILQRSFDQSILSTVQNPNHAMVEWIITQTKPIRFNAFSKLPIELDYLSLETLGQDRIAALCGGKSIFPDRHLLIVNAGTCITYDLLDHQAVFRGGNIAPGMHMRWKAMHHFTGRLPLIQTFNTIENQLLGRSTEEALIFGVLQGMGAEVDRYYTELAVKYGALIPVITGGDAAILKTFIKFAAVYEPLLVMRGLNSILDYL